MKQLVEIKKEIDSILSVKSSEKDETELKKLQQKIQFLTLCKNYLETNPSQDFVKNEIDRLEKRLSLIDDGLTHFSQNNFSKNPKAEWDKLNGVSHIKQQVKALKYLYESAN